MSRRFSASDQEILLSLFHRHVLGFDSVDQVAEAVGISRSRAYDLLNDARNSGLIETTLAVDVDRDDELRFRLREQYRTFGVKEVVLVPALARDPDSGEYQDYIRRRLGACAAAYLQRLSCRAGDHVCLGGGRAMLHLARRFTPPCPGLILRPLAVGSRWRVQNHVDASTVVQILQTRFRSISDKAMSVLSPDILPGGGHDPLGRPEVQACFGPTAKRPRVVVTGIGSTLRVRPGRRAGLHPNTSSYVELIALEMFYRTKIKPRPSSERLTEADLSLFYDPLPDDIYANAAEYLASQSIVAEVCRFGINDAGTVVPTKYDDGFLAIHPEEQLRVWRNARKEPTESVLVLGGSRLSTAARAALRGNYFTTMIVDTSLALALLEAKDWPEEYRNLPALKRRKLVRASQRRSKTKAVAGA